MIGLGIGVGWATKRRLVNYINELIKQFKDRVAADGGTFEAEQCLKNTLNTLGIVVPPIVITAPVISGDTVIGSVISTTNGVFDGVTPLTYTYQWLLDGSPILGATNNTYTVTSNGDLTCKVTATNDFGSANSTSNSLEITYLLDTYLGAAVAYSLRKLRTDYTGSAIRVRRASDNTETNIGFVNNELDTATLTTFCSGTNGFVTTWYDQSTNGNNVTQAISLNQPQIVSSGVVILENGKPAVNFNGITNYLSSVTGFGATEYTGFHAFTIKSFILNQRIIHIKNGGNNIHMIRLGSNEVYPRTLTDDLAYNSPLTIFVNNVMNLSSFYNKDTMYLNNSLVLNKSTANTGVQGSNGVYLGCRADLTSFANLRISETISYAINRSADIPLIDANINSYYSIY